MQVLKSISLINLLAVCLPALLVRSQATTSDLSDPTDYFATDSMHNTFDGQLSVDKYIHYALKSIALVAGYDNDLHRFDKQADSIRSYRRLTSSNQSTRSSEEDELLIEAENWLNQETCKQQLEALAGASRVLFANDTSFLESKELSLINFIDSYGVAPASQLLMGNTMWLGSYEQCTKARVHIHVSNVQVSPRYCVATFRSPNWWPTKEELTEAIASDDTAFTRLGSQRIKLGVCLPQACNSHSAKLLKNQIEAFIKLVRLNKIPFSSFQMTNLFCLPDETSPLRQLSSSALAFIAVISLWALIVLYFSIAYELRRAVHLLSAKPIGALSGPNKLEQVFAFRLCWRALFGSQEDSQQVETTKTPIDYKQSNLISVAPLTLATTDASKQLVAGHSHEVTPILIEKPAIRMEPQVKASDTSKMLNLNVVDGVKVLSMIWLISAHTMLFLMRTMTNGRDFWSILLDGRFITVMAGIFPVDSFFVITGILTAYLKFNKKHGAAMHKLRYWIEAFVHRYLRFMPMYIVIFWYTRDVSEYIGSGPFWDYATADTSLRSMCKQESVFVPLLFQANQKPIEQHCVKPAWYLANDYQYLLITPIFMALIIKSSLIGYTAIVLSVVSSLIAQFLTVYYAKDFTDFEGLINFRPMFAAYVLKNLWRLYVMPYNRIAPYLIGIFTGHLIYSGKMREKKNGSSANSSQESLVEVNPLNAEVASKSETCSTSETTSTHETSSQLQKPTQRLHANPYKGCLKLLLPLIMLISIIYLPKTTQYFTYTGLSARIGASLLIALMRLFWSIAIARLIYVCVIDEATGGFICRFLSSNKWKPWSRIGLSVLLIQWEIIGYYAQTQTQVPYMSIGYLLSAILICSIGTYVVGLLIYLTIEYPLSQIEHLFIHPRLFPKKE